MDSQDEEGEQAEESDGTNQQEGVTYCSNSKQKVI